MALQGSHLRGCTARGALELLKSRPFSKLCIQGAQVKMTNTAAYSERAGHDAVTKAREKLKAYIWSWDMLATLMATTK